MRLILVKSKKKAKIKKLKSKSQKKKEKRKKYFCECSAKICDSLREIKKHLNDKSTHGLSGKYLPLTNGRRNIA